MGSYLGPHTQLFIDSNNTVEAFDSQIISCTVGSVTR